MIESFTEGRVRLRSPLLHDEELARRLSEGLLAIKGVRRAQVNRHTRGLLLEYDKDRLPLERLAPALPIFDRINALERRPADERRAALDAALTDLRHLLG